MFRKLVLAVPLTISLQAEMVVTDPGTYALIIEQIGAATEMIGQMQQQIETLGGIKTATDDVKRQIYHVNDAFMGAMNSMVSATQSLANAIGESPENIDKLFSMDRDSITTSPGQGGVFYEDTAAFIDDIFASSGGSIAMSDFLGIRDAQLRKYIQKDVSNLAWKKIISDQKNLETRMKERMKRTANLMKKVQEESGEEVTVIDMQQTQAQLLAEITQTLNELLELQKSVAVAQALANYKHTNIDNVKKKVELLNDDDGTRRENAYKTNSVKSPHQDALLKSDKSMDQILGF
ncbi:MAG: hypothetical protein LBQ52_10945 [Helicobacteraceae bacterium]|jgi:hypothetical protein|nr:hypothetical protein [Helicobacteraceae bacterium]